MTLSLGCTATGAEPSADDDAWNDTAASTGEGSAGQTTQDTGDDPGGSSGDGSPEDGSDTGSNGETGLDSGLDTETGSDTDTDTDSDSDSDSGGEPQGGGNLGLCGQGGAPQDGLLPLTDLTGTHQGFEGCLYPGSNVHPLPHPTVEPVDGVVGFGSIGMSNGAQEFTYFMNNVATPGPSVVMFNGAQGGQTSAAWADPDDMVWNNFGQMISGSGLTPEQLRVVWIKSALSHNSHATLEDAALAEKAALEDVLRNLADKYPSVRIVYLTSRAYGGYGCGLSPEPAAYAHGHAIKWLIEEQIDGLHDDLPFLAWGPYIWADGATPRSDGHSWLPEDFGDGCHPNQQGRIKVAGLMQQFFMEEAPWYVQ